MNSHINQFFAAFKRSVHNNESFFKIRKTKFILQIIKILIQHKYLIGVDKNLKGELIVFLKLNFQKTHILITELERVSKQSCPVYIKSKQLYSKAHSLRILSTPLGVMTHIDAKKYKVGGILMLQVT